MEHVPNLLCSLFLAEALVQQFSGKGLMSDATVNAPYFLLSVSIGAAMTIFAATRIGLPISTTHALIGGLVGAGFGIGGGELHMEKLLNTFLLPLLVSPLVAASLAWLVFKLVQFYQARQENECACVVVPEASAGSAQTGGTLVRTVAVVPTIVVGSDSQCDNLSIPVVSRFSFLKLADRLHLFSAALICFARGVNDTPKLAALLIAANLLNSQSSVIAIALIMATGGILYARRVADTMSHRMTHIDNSQGLAANLITAITAILVLFASKFGMPVSTTHVSVGSIAGVGASAHTLNGPTIRNVLLSWLATLPLAALFAWMVQWGYRLLLS